jgi:hypothetical protein
MKKLATLAVLGVVLAGASANAGEFLQDVAYYQARGELGAGYGTCGVGCNTCGCSIPTQTCRPTCCTPTCVRTCDAPCGKMVCCPNIVGILGF